MDERDKDIEDEVEREKHHKTLRYVHLILAQHLLTYLLLAFCPGSPRADSG